MLEKEIICYLAGAVETSRSRGDWEDICYLAGAVETSRSRGDWEDAPQRGYFSAHLSGPIL